MLDIKFIRENLEIVKEAAKNKNREVDWDRLLILDDKRRELIGAIEVKREERNKRSKQKTDNKEQRTKGKELKEEIQKLEEELKRVETAFSQLMLTVPNVPDSSVPIGKDATGNKEVKIWGEIPKFDFVPLDHITLAKK